MKNKWLGSSSVVTIVLLAFCGPHAAAAAQFSLAPNYATGTKPCSVAVADLNGDSKPDLVVANSGSNNVSVLLGNGDGTFQAPANYAAGTAPSSVAIGDFNGDGKLDLVVSNASSDNVSILLGNGDGTFQPAAPYSAGSKPSSVAVGDLNGDKNLDLVVADQAGNNISVLFGNGDGTFGAPVPYDVETGPTSVALGYFNGDSFLDIAVANGESNTISVLLNNGNGTFGTAENYGVSQPGDGSDPVSVVVGDFNGDGFADLAVASNVQIWVSVLLGNGDGTFQSPMSHEAGTYPTGVAVGDFNGDGKLDLVASNNGSNTLTVLTGNGDGTLTWIGNFDAAADVIAVAVGDFNADGKLDAVVVNELSDSVSIFLGNGDGTVLAPVSYGIGGTPQAVAVGAFGSNGVPDLVASNGSSGPICTPGCVSVITGKGNGTFDQLAANYDVGSAPKGIAVGDFTGDGNPDVAVANSASNNVSVLLNTGSGTFGSATNYGTGTNPIAVAIGDFNDDKLLDLVVVNAGDGDVSILLGNGNGTFGPAVGYPVGVGPTSVAVGDLTGDRILDLAVTNGSAAGMVGVLIGNGDGTFQSVVNYPVGAYPTSVVIADFNGDGKLDLAVANAGASSLCTSPAGSGSVSILLGNGDGTFGAAVSYCAGVDPLSVAEGDFNGDGKADMVVANGGSAGASSGVSVLLGNGDGTFQAPVNYYFGNIDDSVVVADLNGDGAPDLAVTSVNAGVTVLLNPGGTFMNASSSLNPSSDGQNVTFTATIAPSVILPGQPAPTGTVVFDDGATAMGSGSLASGTATFTTSSLSVGTHEITAVYSGDSHFNPNVAPSITQTVTSGPVVVLSLTSLSFSTQLVGTSSASKPVTLTNTGAATLTITSISISGSNPADFSETNNCGSSVAAGASCTISVTFKPTAKGTRTASLSIVDNAPGSPQTVSLTGAGTEVKLSPASLNFGSVQVGHRSAAKTVTLTNTGTVLLSITNIGITGTNGGDFAETNTCGVTLGAGSSCSISVMFTPRAKGNRTGSLSISDNGGGSPQTVSVSGTGT
ncbi:MAG TPA: FG-GAP-like repeat-containing protein [Terriglobia bacterium]|nr:FG-GAP-like repeat-containing protein [Terriglobia bacterium]